MNFSPGQGPLNACLPSLLRLSFLRKSKLVARKQGRYAKKAAAQLFRISDCRFRIFLFSFSIRIPQFGGGPIGRPAGRAYNGITLFLGEEGLARPAQEMMRAS